MYYHLKSWEDIYKRQILNRIELRELLSKCLD